MFSNDFRPNIVVGNPPFNNGEDIDFVMKSCEICKEYVCMITPAKWQTSDEKQNINSENSYGDFRSKVVPRMEYVRFNPDVSEVFTIRNIDGITWYIVDMQEEHRECIVENANNHQKYFNSVEKRCIRNMESLNNIGNEIANYLSSYERFQFPEISLSKRWHVSTGSKIVCGNGWGYDDINGPCGTLNRAGKMKVIGDSIILDSHNYEKDNREYAKVYFESDDIHECESYISWLECKLVGFLVMANISKLTNVLTNEYFRFVPKPPYGFSKIYSDMELYNYYKLPNRYIDVIESVILDRKR